MKSILDALELIVLVGTPNFLFQCMKYNTSFNVQLMMCCMEKTIGFTDLQLALRYLSILSRDFLTFCDM